MADEFDVTTRLAEGRPAVDNTATYVWACHQLGYQNPDLTLHSAQVRDWYSSEDSLDLRALDTDRATFELAVAVAERALETERHQLDALSAAWDGGGADAAAEFLSRHADAAGAVSAAVRDAADTLAALRDNLWQMVDQKVVAVIGIDARRDAERPAWRAASQSVVTGVGDRSTASEIVDQQVKPFVDNDIRLDWLTAVRTTIEAVAASYESAIVGLTGNAAAVFEIPGELGPPLPPRPPLPPPSPVPPAPSPAIPPTAPPAPSIAPIAMPNWPAGPQPLGDAATSPVSTAPAGAMPPMPQPAGMPGAAMTPPEMAGGGLTNPGAGIGGALGGIADTISGLVSSLADIPGQLDVPDDSLDTAEGLDEVDPPLGAELDKTEKDEAEPEEVHADDPAAEPLADPTEESSVADDACDDTEPADPKPTPPAPPLDTPPPPDAPPPAPPSPPAVPADGETPCETAADELPQVGR